MASVEGRGSSKPDVPVIDNEIGNDSDLPFSTPFDPVKSGVVKSEREQLYEVSSLSDSTYEGGPTVRQLETMRRQDGQAQALFNLLTLPIRSALTTAEVVVDDDSGSDERDFIEKVLFSPPELGGMTVTLDRVMSQILSSLFTGFAAFEKVFTRPKSGPLKGKIVLDKLAFRPAHTVSFVTNEDGSYRGFRQLTYANGKTSDVYIPKDYSFYFAAQEERRKYYGVSYFETAYVHYSAKAKIYYLANLAAQRNAVGTRVGTTPQGASPAQRRNFAKSLQNISAAQWMMHDEKWKVEMLREGGHFDFVNFINHHNSMMSKTILAAFFDSNQGAGQSEGSLVNFAKPGDSMFVLMLRTIMSDIAAQINHYIIPQLIDLNFKSGVYPRFSWGNFTDEQRHAISTTFDRAVANGNATPEFLRELEKHQAKEFGLTIDYDAIAEREANEKAMAQAAQMGEIPVPPADGEPTDPDALPAPTDGATSDTPATAADTISAGLDSGEGQDPVLASLSGSMVELSMVYNEFEDFMLSALDQVEDEVDLLSVAESVDEGDR